MGEPLPAGVSGGNSSSDGEEDADSKVSTPSEQGGGAAHGDEPPPPFVDPITFELMRDPWMTPAGITYERGTILEEIERRGICPFSQEAITEADLRPNRALKDMIELYLKEKEDKK